MINIQVNVFDPLLPPTRWTTDQSLVTVTATDPSRWVFTTTEGGPADKHPVSGNRIFGVDVAGPDWIFYTMGADRVTSLLDWTLNPTDAIWRGADRLWLSLQQQVAKFINSHDGEASIQKRHSNRYSWSMIELALGLPDQTEI